MSDAERTPTGCQLWAGTFSQVKFTKWFWRKNNVGTLRYCIGNSDFFPGNPETQRCKNKGESWILNKSFNLANGNPAIPDTRLHRSWRSDEVPSGRYEDRRESQLHQDTDSLCYRSYRWIILINSKITVEFKVFFKDVHLRSAKFLAENEHNKWVSHTHVTHVLSSHRSSQVQRNQTNSWMLNPTQHDLNVRQRLFICRKHFHTFGDTFQHLRYAKGFGSSVLEVVFPLNHSSKY